MSGLQEAAVFQSLEEARVAIGYLQANGVEACLADAHIQSLFGSALLAGECRVMAPPEQISEAKRLLEEVAGRSAPTMEERNDRDA